MIQNQIVLRSHSIFYVRDSGYCFWCKAPCCRIDIAFEAFLCRDCEPAVWADIDRINRAQFGEDYA